MRMPLLLIFFLTLSCKIVAQPGWDWAYPAYSVQTDIGDAISTSAVGYSYVTGTFSDTATFGTHTIASYGGSDIFLARYDSTGNCLWVKHAGAASPNYNYDYGTGVAQDGAGNVYVAGNFLDAGIFDTIALGSMNSVTMFLARYDPNGNLAWVRAVTTPGSFNYCKGVALDQAGNPVIVGNINFNGGYTVFGTDTLRNRGSFVAKYDASGNELYAKALGSYNHVVVNAVAIDLYDNIYCAGELSAGNDTILGNPVSPTAPGVVNSLLVKLSPAGNPLWLRTSADTASSSVRIHSVCCDKTTAYICGEFWGTVSFGAITVSEPGGNQEACVVKYDASGNELWASQSLTAGCCSAASALDVTTDGNGNALIAGYLNDTLSFGPVALNASAGNAFVAAFDAAGAPLYAIATSGASPNAVGNSISTDNTGRAYISGYAQYTTFFSSYTVPDHNGIDEDIFVARVSDGSMQGVSEIPKSSAVSFTAGRLTISDPALLAQSPVFVVYDISGREMMRLIINDPVTPIDISGFAHGVYCWQLLDEKGLATGKLSVL